MARPTNEELFEWAASPPDWKIDGFVTSEAEHDQLRAILIAERLRVLYEMAHDGLNARLGEDEPQTPEAQNGEIDFTTLPLRLTLNKRECHQISGKLWSSFTEGWWYSQPRALELWNDTAHVGAALGGYGILMSKYSNMPYVDYVSPDGTERKTADEMFEAALNVSEGYAAQGFRSALLMDGIHQVDYASLDLDLIEADLNQGYPWHFYPAKFWEMIIEAKRQYDNDHGRLTYADVVKKVADGLYIAPYLDATVRDSGSYLTRDSVVATAIDCGLDAARGNTLFAQLIDALDTEGMIHERFYDKGWRTTKRMGCVFFKKELLIQLRETLKSKNAPQRTWLIDELISKYLNDENVGVDDYDQDIYQYLVFGA